MIVDESGVACTSNLSHLDPFLHIFHYLIALKIEMKFNNSLESLWWSLDVINHRIQNIAVANDIAISLIFVFSFFSTGFSFESGLVEIDVITHDDSLQGYQHLEKSRKFGIPIFGGLTSPCTE